MSNYTRPKLNLKNLIKVGIPKHLASLTVDDLEDFGSDERATLIDYVKEYVGNIDSNYDDNVGLLLMGSNGVGKTLIASLILKEAYRERYVCKRITFSEFINKYTRLWDKSIPEEEREEFYYYIKGADFLVLEEIGKEFSKPELAVTILEELLRYREERGIPTIICTNLNSDSLLSKYGMSVFSLLKGNFKPLVIVGKDLRKTKFDMRQELE